MTFKPQRPSRAKNLNDPHHWLAWLRACLQDETSPIRLPRPKQSIGRKPTSVLGMITGQDRRALSAVAACWSLYGGSDDAGRAGALMAIRALLPAMQGQCRMFARELIAQSLDWPDRERLWPLVQGPLVACSCWTDSGRDGAAPDWFHLMACPHNGTDPDLASF